MSPVLLQETPLAAVFAHGGALLLFAAVLGTYSRDRRLDHLRWWAFSWLLLALYHLGLFLVLPEGRIDEGWPRAVASGAIQAGGNLHLLSFALGVYVFVLQREVAPRMVSLGVLISVMAGVAAGLGSWGAEPEAAFLIRSGVWSLLGAVTFLGAVVTLHRSRVRRRSPGMALFLGSLLVYGLEQAHHFVAALGGAVAGWDLGHLALTGPFDLLMQIAIGLAMTLLVTEHLRRTSEHNAEALLQAEEELRQSQRLETVTTLAGGIAHDYNNILTAIVGYTDLIQDAVEPDSTEYEDLDSIRKAVGRATGLTQELLAFSRKLALKAERIDVNAVLKRLHGSLERTLGEDIELTIELDPEVDKIEVDPAQLELLIVNLCLNARDAMAEGGSLLLTTGRVQLGRLPSSCRSPEGPGVVIEVRDTGKGMDERTCERIFEPFFTTKSDPRSSDDGRVPGMGLSAGYGFVRQSGGDIVVRSRPAQGTTFRIYFPATTAPDAPSPSPLPKPRRGSETVLLVEDEDQVRDLGMRALRRNGYDVLVAENGVEALVLAEHHREGIDLLVTDVVMPRMSGQALSRALRGLHPETRTLFVSGYSAAEMLERGLNEPDHLLTKPFTAEELLREVAGALASGRGAARSGD